MLKKYMICPVHSGNCMESSKTIKNFYSSLGNQCAIFHCKKCKRYYFNPGTGMTGTKDTGKIEKNTGIKVFITSQKVYLSNPISSSEKTVKNYASFGKTIWNKPSSNIAKQSQNVSKSTAGSTNEVRIHLLKKEEIDQRLSSSFAHLLVEYPQLGNFISINDLIKKVFPSKIDQRCVVKNMSYVGSNGHVVKRVEIYNLKSSFLKTRLPENTFLAFSGKLSGGEFVIDELRVILNPIMKKDDSEHTFVFLYDGPNHPNALWGLAEEAATNPEELKGELADWNSYLDWKRQLAEMRIQGIKYIGIRIDVEEREMSILAVSEGEDNYIKFRRALRRNEVSAFSNVYSSDPWMFKFNHDDSAYRNETGVELVFTGEGRRYTRQEIGASWDQLRDFFKKYSNSNDENVDLAYLLGGINRNYFEPFYIELKFELSNNATDIIERHMRRTGSLPEDLEESLAAEFYGDGFLATSQVGDFALLRRLKTAVFDLAKGKAACQGMDNWLFDISKARIPEKLETVEVWQNDSINDRQKLAVEKILSAPDVCLIQGPPGTGKTTVIAEAIYQMVIRNKRVLVASQANLAVDNALERLISNPKIRAIRLGSEKKIDSSVNNITEEHVLESFYDSVVKYIDLKYLEKWKAADEIIDACNNDLEKVEALEKDISNAESEIDHVKSELINLESEWDSKGTYDRQSSLKMVKVSLIMIKSLIGGAVDDIELVLDKNAILNIWEVIYPFIIDVQKKGLWLTRVGIDSESLDSYAQVNKANEILRFVFLNSKRAVELEKKLKGADDFGGNSEELEILKIQEQSLKEKVLKDMDPKVMKEWKVINDRIAEYTQKGGVLSEYEKQLFGGDESESNKVICDSNRMLQILDNSVSVIHRMETTVTLVIDRLIEESVSKQEEYDKKERIRDEKKKSYEESESALQLRVLKDKEIIGQVLDKYMTDRENLESTLALKKESVEDNTGLNRNEWEDIMTGFAEWVGNIPDYAQEKDLFLKTFINGCNVVGVSCTENARTLNEAGFDDFDLVIIDEVSKATPPELLIPMLRGRKIVLVGDHRQLPPLFNEHEKTYLEVAEQQDSLPNDESVITLTMDDFIKYKDMVTASLFEKYFENGGADIKETLTYQYRMHKDIMDIVNLFYDGYLQDGNDGKYEDGRKSHNLFIHSTSGTAMIVPERHAYWIDSSTLDGEPIYEQRKAGSTSAENIVEAYTIIELLKKMEIEYSNRSTSHIPVSVGVISFYYDQVSLLRKLVKKESFHAIDIDINTVDRFQGKEKEIIIVSLVRNVKNARHNKDSHIAAFQRINVAFSRAQNLLVIVGAKDMYAPQPVEMADMNTGEERTVMVYKKIIEMMDMKGTLFTCDEIIPESLVGKIFEMLSKEGVLEI